MVIKHLVISGGGPTGLLSYGAAKYLEKISFGILTIFNPFMEHQSAQ